MKTIRIISAFIFVAILSSCSKEDELSIATNNETEGIQPSMLSQQYVPVSIKDTAGNNIMTFSYDPSKKLTSMTDAMGNITKFDYDGSNKPVIIHYEFVNSSSITIRDYLAYNPGSQLPDLIKRYQIDDLGNETQAGEINITYDGWGRKTSEVMTDISGSQIEVAYLYNSDGNLVRRESIEFGVTIENKEYKNFDSSPHPMSALEVYSIIPFNEKHQNNCKRIETTRPGMPNSVIETFNISLNVKGMPKRVTRNLNGVKTAQIFKYVVK